jgi:hypothetical protein
MFVLLLLLLLLLLVTSFGLKRPSSGQNLQKKTKNAGPYSTKKELKFYIMLTVPNLSQFVLKLFEI